VVVIINLQTTNATDCHQKVNVSYPIPSAQMLTKTT